QFDESDLEFPLASPFLHRAGFANENEVPHNGLAFALYRVVFDLRLDRVIRYEKGILRAPDDDLAIAKRARTQAPIGIVNARKDTNRAGLLVQVRTDPDHLSHNIDPRRVDVGAEGSLLTKRDAHSIFGVNVESQPKPGDVPNDERRKRSRYRTIFMQV